MRRSKPPGSADTLRGVIVLALAIGAVLIAGDWIHGMLALVALVLIDHGILASRHLPGEEDLSVRITLRAEDGRRALIAGGAGVLVVNLANRMPDRSLDFRLVPILPPGLASLGAIDSRVRLGAGRRVRLRYPVTLDRVGTVVVPGVMSAQVGPLGIARRRLVIPARCLVPVLPDYGTSAHPVVMRFLTTGLGPSEARRRRALKGTGSDFAEIRDYRIPDSLRRVDWKATARRNRVMVREYEEPREFTLRIFMDGSVDLTHGEDGGAGFARSAAMIGKLAYVAMGQSMSLELSLYDHEQVLYRRLSAGALGVRKLLADVVAAPRDALIRAARTRLSRRERAALATRLYEGTVGRWRHGRPGKLDPASWTEFLVDHYPGQVSQLATPCPQCSRAVFEDEGICGACGTERTPGGQPPRGACLSSLLIESLRRSRGREMWVVISSCRGGETSDPVARSLDLAVRKNHAVHVVVPESLSIRDLKATMPVSMGVYPDATDALSDADALYRSTLVDDFARRLRARGVAVQTLRDAAAMEEVVARLIMDEVL